MSDKDKYLSLRDKKYSELGGRLGPRSVGKMPVSEVKKRLAELKKDLTWSPLPDVNLDKLPKGKMSKDDAIGMAMDLMQTTPTGAIAGVIKEKGGNWLGDSVKKALGRLKRSKYDFVDEGDLATLNKSVEGINTWIEGPLQKYVKNRMATPDDEIRKLADQGILHVDPEQLNFRPEMYGKYPSSSQKYMATSPQAKIWEGVSDNSVGYDRAGAFIRGADANEYDKAFLREYPWIEKIDPETPIYDLADDGGAMRDLGFDHLIDELSNAMDETSGFPQNLRLTPEGLQGLSIEEAIRKVDGINKFRAEKAKKANARFAAAEGIPVHKDYGDGWKWLEYKKTDDAKDTTKLAEWLKSEGDTMGHCVGGYCDDVAQGRSRILSLRDPEGKSISTIELSPHIDYNNPENQRWMINQIKGPGNRKPDERAMKYLQDFIKSDDWADVRDLENTGLRRYGKDLMTDEEAISNRDFQDFMKNKIKWSGDKDELLKYQGHNLPSYWNEYLRSNVGGGI